MPHGAKTRSFLKTIRSPSFDRLLKLYNPNAFQYDMSFAPWSVLEIFDDVNDKLHALDLLFNEILDHDAPARSIKVRGRPNPCITEDTRELKKSRNYWRKRASSIVHGGISTFSYFR